MKRLLKLLLLLLWVQQAKAQSTERVQINAGNFVVPQKEPLSQFIYPFIRNIGISYAHQLTPRIGVRAGYNQWFRVLNIGQPYKSEIDGYFNPFKRPEDRALGDIDSYHDYRSVDLAATYRLLQSGHHELYTGAGVSYTWGWYYEYTGIYNEPGYPDWLFRLDSKKHQDLGLLAEVGYNYLLFHNRVNVGVSETVKGYTTLPFQFYTNINIGYNLNWGFKKKTNRK